MFDYERGLVPINATAHKRSLFLIRLDDAAAYEKNQFLKQKYQESRRKENVDTNCV